MDRIYILQWVIIFILVVGLVILTVLYTNNTKSRENTQENVQDAEEPTRIATTYLSESIAPRERVSHGPGESIWVKAQSTASAHVSHVIPKRIMQTYKTNNVPTRMSAAIKSIVERHPTFDYIFFDDAACLAFMTEKTHPDVLEAYESLIPGAYKADIFRLAFLYEYGGWYLDVSMCVDSNMIPLDHLAQQRDLVVVRDLPGENHTIYQALIGCTAKHPIIQYILDSITKLVLKRIKPVEPLSLTGPGAFGSSLNAALGRPLFSSFVGYEHPDIVFLDNNGKQVQCKGKSVVNIKYPDWAQDRFDTFSTHYSTLFHGNQLYLHRVERPSVRMNKNQIPVWTSWETHHVTSTMKFVMEEWKHHNPALEFIFMDRQQRIAFMYQEYGEDVGKLFSSLRPGAFQSDWWRFAILYKYGGVYMDVCMYPSTCKLSDWVHAQKPSQTCLRMALKDRMVFNGFILSSPKHPFVWACLEAITQNVKSQIYPQAETGITGNYLIDRVLHQFCKQTQAWRAHQAFPHIGFEFLSSHSGCIYDKQGNSLVNHKYHAYDTERHFMGDVDWGQMFRNRNVYS